MLNNYKILTITHRNARLDELKHFVIQGNDEDRVQANLNDIKTSFGIKELFYLNTCNRIMYMLFTEQECNAEFTARFFQAVNPQISELVGEKLGDMLQIYEGIDAIKHLYEVSSSIDSMVVGEREILRQVRNAYDQSLNWGLTGDNIRLAMQCTVESAKKVYANTRIGEKPVSVVSLAIQKLMQSRLSRKSRILLIGAGQTNALVAKFLLKHQYSQVTVFNRTLQRAVDLADKLSGSAYALEDLKSYTKGFDAIIICTGATKAFLDVELYHQLLAGETDEKLIIDLAIPHNVNPEVVKQFPVNYIEIEDIRSLAHQNLAFREQEVGRVRELLQEKLDEFGLVYRQRQIEIAMKGVPAKIKAIKSHAINSVFKKDLEGLDQDTLDLMNRMMSYMEKQCIGVPMKAARQVITK